MTYLENLHESLENTCNPKHLLCVLFALTIRLGKVFEDSVGLSLLDDVRSGEQFWEEDCAIISKLARITDVLCTNIDDSFDKDLKVVALLFGIDGVDVKWNENDNAEPKSEDGRNPMKNLWLRRCNFNSLRDLLEVQDLDARLQVGNLMREELYNCLVPSNIADNLQCLKQIWHVLRNSVVHILACLLAIQLYQLHRWLNYLRQNRVQDRSLFLELKEHLLNTVFEVSDIVFSFNIWICYKAGRQFLPVISYE